MGGLILESGKLLKMHLKVGMRLSLFGELSKVELKDLTE